MSNNPIERPCPACSGNGHIYFDAYAQEEASELSSICAGCKGTGKISAPQASTSEKVVGHLRTANTELTERIADLEDELQEAYKIRDENDEVIAGLEAGTIKAEKMS